MGREVLLAVSQAKDTELVAAIDRKEVGAPLRQLAGPECPDLVIEDKLGEALDRTSPDVMVDFTLGSAAPDHALSALQRGIAAVIGATGMAEGSLREVEAQCRQTGVPALVVPNFAVGAVLMMRFAELAAAWLPDAEIIELHHDQKVDAPSGTALHTAERIDRGRKRGSRVEPTKVLKLEGARGGVHKGVPIHSVRLPGFVAHQKVIFGGQGEVLTLSHDSVDRRSFMPGVLLAIREVRNLSGLVVGLEQVMFR